MNIAINAYALKSPAPLEELNRAFVLFGRSSAAERAEIAAAAGPRIDLSRIEAVLAGLEFSDHFQLLASPTAIQAAYQAGRLCCLCYTRIAALPRTDAEHADRKNRRG